MAVIEQQFLALVLSDWEYAGKSYDFDFCGFELVPARCSLVLALLDRLAARGGKPPEWQCLIDDLLDLSRVEVEQDGRRALLRTAPGPTIDPVCRALGITLPPVFQELPVAAAGSPNN